MIKAPRITTGHVNTFKIPVTICDSVFFKINLFLWVLQKLKGTYFSTEIPSEEGGAQSYMEELLRRQTLEEVKALFKTNSIFNNYHWHFLELLRKNLFKKELVIP